MKKSYYANCEHCPLAAPYNDVVPSHGSKRDIKLIVVGEGPGAIEVAQGKPFVGPTGDVLRGLLARWVDPETEVFYTNATLCFPRLGEKETVMEQAVTACNPRLAHLLKLLPSDVPVLALGKYAQQALGLRPDVWEVGTPPYGNHWTLGTIHPAATLYDPTQMVYLERSLEKFFGGTRTVGKPELHYRIVDTIGGLPRLDTFGGRSLAVDIETNTTDWTDPDARVLLFGVGYANISWLLTENVLKQRETQEWLRAFWEANALNLGGHNFKFDVTFMNRVYGTPLEHGWDTMLMASDLHEHWYKGLKDLSAYFFNAPDYEETLVHSWLRENVKVASKRTYDKLPPTRLQEYLAWDLYYTSKLRSTLMLELLRANRLDAPHRSFTMRASNALAQVEAHGFAVDLDAIKREQAAMQPDIEALRKAVECLTDSVVKNPGSSQQVAHYLYDVLKLKHSVKGEKPRSTAKAVLDQLFDQGHKKVQAIVAYRRVSKLKSAYLDNLLEKARQDKQGVYRVHPRYKLGHVVTGRLSAVDPAIQTIPRPGDKRDEPPSWLRAYLKRYFHYQLAGNYGKRIKSVYVAAPGHKLLVVDGSQWEIRVIAALSKDPYLMEACGYPGGVHAKMCNIMFGEGQWGKAEKAEEKRALFAVTYGGTVESAVSVSTLTAEQKQRMFDAFDVKLAVFKDWRLAQLDTAKAMGVINTPYFNRGYHFDFVNPGNEYDVRKWAVNYPVQGAAAMITVDALTYALPRLQAIGAHIVATIHDSIIVEVPIGLESQAFQIVSSELIAAGTRFSDTIPWVAEAELGDSWGNVKEFNV